MEEVLAGGQVLFVVGDGGTGAGAGVNVVLDVAPAPARTAAISVGAGLRPAAVVQTDGVALQVDDVHVGAAFGVLRGIVALGAVCRAGGVLAVGEHWPSRRRGHRRRVRRHEAVQKQGPGGPADTEAQQGHPRHR